MALDEVKVTRAIVESYFESFLKYTEADVALVGAGPANLVAARRLAEADVKTVLFEKRLSVGGGLWGGGMMFPRIVVQKEACRILDDYGIWYREFENEYFIANAIETVAKLTAGAIDAGAEIINLVSVEDVMIREDDRVTGLVVNWTAAEMAGIHVDPLSIRARLVIDGTGHEASVCRVVQRKIPGACVGATGVRGEKPMWADVGEKTVVEATAEVYPGLIAAGMAAATVAAGPRMGPIFGGMLLSGEKAAALAIEILGR
ncbi:MAG: putative ribose 1,5-bisphosphate isomerase [Methanosaeta sp. PtaB.Bin039]|nr:MAG: putative ribose 1,5-bisphosphate isomerase [Methanosaeta sp. PtaB.Bin039]OPY46170.1 MAG: putative ribose 1,5-bisphosphate isomerase [Methanosaeta sp. PtaU1.Bin028]HOT07460.1 sulfide-dependent adenosine diphosphate thiazole synthase [Methanotrichaceae archaeon]HQF17015.1 sulfide-dependent adenosine diphosphate thiazole synthase [Methanotrichaceae archaeon]HQI91635.1 sulfide-dependent adenosine diphosphate thiazole synthase [Methanotrichaceae archaeon]